MFVYVCVCTDDMLYSLMIEMNNLSGLGLEILLLLALYTNSVPL